MTIYFTHQDGTTQSSDAREVRLFTDIVTGGVQWVTDEEFARFREIAEGIGFVFEEHKL